MVSIPLYSQMAKMTQKEIWAWLLSLLWGGRSLFLQFGFMFPIVCGK